MCVFLCVLIPDLFNTLKQKKKRKAMWGRLLVESYQLKKNEKERKEDMWRVVVNGPTRVWCAVGGGIEKR